MQEEAVKQGLVYIGDQVFDNIFLALGFSEEESAELVRESKARMQKASRRNAVIYLTIGKRKRVKHGRGPQFRQDVFDRRVLGKA